ncbi:MAG TPA: MerR family transcriptional regulator [Hyphomicrobiales bacterium]|nr:MerR family transcriptional regulator [Hyphomicrobiales bacterium]
MNAFRTISEVADELDVPKHVLRFWEGKFSQVRPMKRGGGRRYYRPEDVDLLRGIRWLLYGDGYTIKGVQRILRDNGVRYVKECWSELPDEMKAKAAGPQIPNLAGEAANEARRGVLKHEPASEERPVPQQGKTAAAGDAPSWTNEQRLALSSVLRELEDCRNMLKTILAESNGVR